VPWKERSLVQERQSFIMEWLADGISVAELCRTFGISRTLGYKYIHRYLEHGLQGLQELSRAPRQVWNRTTPCVEMLIVDIRRARPRYGALTIHLLLKKAIDRKAIPAVSTIDLILKRHGLVKPRRRVRRIRDVHPVFVAARPNVIWSADFKGKFRTRDMRYCYPLTIMDTYSRYVLAIVGMHQPTFEATKAVFEALFEEYGLPDQIHTDNGEPFGSAVSLSRLTRLAVWFMDLGIIPVYSDPGHPEQNPEHERMHRDLKAETTRPAAYNLSKQQQKFDSFRREHNEVRPHQALHGRTPQDLYYRSARTYDGRIQPYEYPPEFQVKYVCRNGAIRWGAHRWVTVSTTLIEKYVGLEQIADGKWRVYYRNYLLGYLDEQQLRIMDDQGRFRRNVKKCQRCA
jgi:transposase InsO family protein